VKTGCASLLLVYVNELGKITEKEKQYFSISAGNVNN